MQGRAVGQGRAAIPELVYSLGSRARQQGRAGRAGRAAGRAAGQGKAGRDFGGRVVYSVFWATGRAGQAGIPELV